MSFVQGNLGSHKKVVTKTIFVKKYSGPPIKKTPYQKMKYNRHLLKYSGSQKNNGETKCPLVKNDEYAENSGKQKINVVEISFFNY